MRILFVCLGNICRSPTAEAIARNQGLACDSAGTGNWHIGKPPYGPMQDAARARGIDMSGLRARQFGHADFHDFDLIIGMDDENIANIEALRPTGSETPVVKLTDYGSSADHVPDPYFTRDFDEALDIIDDAITGLRQTIQG
ncbi:low molecular weight protein-tyrosine-phosphatase [Shimia ponticola]|uniref:low molecular weight protein-tyrosine-phosphatase n=1 Tax=Shimia ponticola TaxID=2582893 RepID=UPI0011BFBF57|nr:low molecular weight protein-tyrosine-phosphatase [Shimia ponticola]